MVRMPVPCPYCQSEQVVKRGKTETGKQRYRCQNPDCAHQSFLLDPAYRGRLPEITQHVLEMSLNGSGVRDTARVLTMSTATVIHELTKKGLHSPPSTHHASTRDTRALWTSSSVELTTQKSRRCGALWARSRSHGGSGLPSITGPARSSRMSLAGVQMRYFCR
jgi:transposase-like protein